jgi:hypothetical protein
VIRPPSVYSWPQGKKYVLFLFLVSWHWRLFCNMYPKFWFTPFHTIIIFYRNVLITNAWWYVLFYFFFSWLLFTLSMRFPIAAALSTTYLWHFHTVLSNTWTVTTLPHPLFLTICIHLCDVWRMHPWLSLVIFFNHTWICI